MPQNKDSLFLLEALVEKITFYAAPCFSDGAFKTCVKIFAPNVEPLEICDDDSGLATGGTPFVRPFNSGKSCLFFLKEAEIQSAMSRFLINVAVLKKLPCGCLPHEIQLGKTSIDMTKEFVQARNQNLQSPGTAGFQALQDTFRIIGEDNSDTAEIVMYIRLSCFGSLIVTKFQGAAGPITVGAGAVDSRSCNPPRPYQTEDDPCVCGAHASGKKPLMGNTQVCRGGGAGTCPPARDPYRVMPCAEPDDACFCTGPHPVAQSPSACRNTNAYCQHIPKDCCPPGNKVVFQLPSDTCNQGHKQRAHFKFNSDGVGDLAREEPGQLVPITSGDYQGVVYDFPKQVIKIRVGKTVEITGGRRSKLEYQFITPVISHETEIPVKDTRPAQWSSCCPACCGITHQLDKC
ncbi:hypothetical protein NE865_15423 [Phthorimaea operculella]|nr:hypothetical protein NE865_15423 [Phthorimaea operculella]